MTLFTDMAPEIMNDLIDDFDLTVEDAAALVGNLGHESGGFKFLQEIKPVVPGSRGGYGWPQWTGPRRVAFEAYCKRNGLDPKSYKANYGYLWVELNGSEKAAIPALKAAPDLDRKVIAFEQKFLRAGIKHYDSRQNYARQALAAWKNYPRQSKPVDPIVTQPDDPGVDPAADPLPNLTTVYVAIGIGAAIGVAYFVAKALLS